LLRSHDYAHGSGYLADEWTPAGGRSDNAGSAYREPPPPAPVSPDDQATRWRHDGSSDQTVDSQPDLAPRT
jgi:hypothetical protein